MAAPDSATVANTATIKAFVSIMVLPSISGPTNCIAFERVLSQFFKSTQTPGD
jgi:hypothetical protein